MENLVFLAPLLSISGVAVLVLAIIAVVQDMKQERKYGYRQAFYTIVTLVMLVMVVGSGVSLLTIGLKEAMPSSKEYLQRNNMPPAPYLVGSVEKGATAAYTCTDSCEFNANDKQAFTDWKTQYEAWKTNANSNTQLRRDLAGGLALFLIALPIYWLFMRWMNRGAKEETESHQRPSPLRSVYFYGVAFAGLVMAVVGGAMLLNTVLKVALNTGSTNPNAVPATLSNYTMGADSILVCQDKCGFTADDIALVQDWKAKNADYVKGTTENAGSTANDLATTIPLVVFGAPLFWYHFARIRKETQSTTQPV